MIVVEVFLFMVRETVILKDSMLSIPFVLKHTHTQIEYV